ncbi:RIBOSOMAL RNA METHYLTRANSFERASE MRM2, MITOCHONDRIAL [Ceraceosorus bombacis]|uniref:rRNA methyltransferase 2, mitochondrial n=1 Tax=Ceraceosorus bombacis TaxID=401625 RepID=A0A0P1BEM4_9BASI|nr:RIBOSOMAL RNA METHYLTRANSFERASE MRM2, MITOCHONDRIAL [Ceraceosorus bombacis]
MKNPPQLHFVRQLRGSQQQWLFPARQLRVNGACHAHRSSNRLASSSSNDKFSAYRDMDHDFKQDLPRWSSSSGGNRGGRGEEGRRHGREGRQSPAGYDKGIASSARRVPPGDRGQGGGRDGGPGLDRRRYQASNAHSTEPDEGYATFPKFQNPHSSSSEQRGTPSGRTYQMVSTVEMMLSRRDRNQPDHLKPIHYRGKLASTGLNLRQINFKNKSAYKLFELDSKLNILRGPSEEHPERQVVIDLGAYPGGWTEVAIDTLRQREDRARQHGLLLKAGGDASTATKEEDEPLVWSIDIKSDILEALKNSSTTIVHGDFLRHDVQLLLQDSIRSKVGREESLLVDNQNSNAPHASPVASENTEQSQRLEHPGEKVDGGDDAGTRPSEEQINSEAMSQAPLPKLYPLPKAPGKSEPPSEAEIRRLQESTDKYLDPSGKSQRLANVVMSDMCPSLSGNKARDEEAMLRLLTASFSFAYRNLKWSATVAPNKISPTGDKSLKSSLKERQRLAGSVYVAKYFPGKTANAFHKSTLLHAFEHIRLVKCKASKDTSIEMFFVCFGLKPGFERYLQQMEQENLDFSNDQPNHVAPTISTARERRGEC